MASSFRNISTSVPDDLRHDHPGPDRRRFAERIKFGAVLLFTILW
jgi:hypothetical protein